MLTSLASSLGLNNVNQQSDFNLVIITDYKKEPIPCTGIHNENTEPIDSINGDYGNAHEEYIDEEDPYSDTQLVDFFTSSQLDKESLSNIYEFSQSLNGTEIQAPEGIFQSLTNGISNATYSVGKIIGTPISYAINAYQEFIKFMWPPQWVIEKYKCSVKNIAGILKDLQASSHINLDTELGILVQRIAAPVNTYIQQENFQAAHSSFLLGLRSALESEIYLDELKKYQEGRYDYDQLVPELLELCRIRFEDGQFYGVLNTLMSDLGVIGENKLEKKDFDIIDSVDPSLKISAFEVNLKKLLGHINVNFDPHLQGNIPYIYDILNFGEKEVRLMRIGTPTIEGYRQKAKIIEEFRGYLQHCTLNKKTHLYISLQNDKVKSVFKGDTGGDESGRNDAIKELQNEFPKNFFVVVLAHDSSFYKQVDAKEIPLGSQNSHEFLSKFTTELFGDNTGFYFPSAWKDDPIFSDQVYNLLTFVLEAFYDNKNELTRQEKQDFIQIFYAHLSLFLITYSNADNANVTCKDGIDRAGMLNSLIQKLVMTIEGDVDKAESRRKHKVLTHSAAFWTKSQAIIKKGTGDCSNGRQERLLSADEKMNEKGNGIVSNLGVKNIKEFLSCAVA